MSGPPAETRAATKTMADVSAGELEIARENQRTSAEDRAQRVALQQPIIDKNKALATGSPAEATKAIAPALAQISSGYTAAKSNIEATMPQGAARDLALAELERDKATTVGKAKADAVNAAPEILANVGAGLGAFSLQEIGASLRGFEGASTTAQAQAKAANDAKATQLQFLGGLAQTAGGVASMKPWK